MENGPKMQNVTGGSGINHIELMNKIHQRIKHPQNEAKKMYQEIKKNIYLAY